MYGRTNRRKVKYGKRHTKGRKHHGGQLQSAEQTIGLKKEPSFFEKLKKHISSFPGKLESGVRSTYHSARQAVGMNGGKSCGLYGGSNCQYTGGKRRRRKTQKKRSHRKH